MFSVCLFLRVFVLRLWTLHYYCRLLYYRGEIKKVMWKMRTFWIKSENKAIVRVFLAFKENWNKSYVLTNESEAILSNNRTKQSVTLQWYHWFAISNFDGFSFRYIPPNGIHTYNFALKLFYHRFFYQKTIYRRNEINIRF